MRARLPAVADEEEEEYESEEETDKEDEEDDAAEAATEVSDRHVVSWLLTSRPHSRNNVQAGHHPSTS